MIPHGGGLNGAIHWITVNVNAPWAELYMPSPGGPNEVYQLWEDQYLIRRGLQGACTRPADRPGFG